MSVGITLTAGLHQRCDDSYFRVDHFNAEPGVEPGWYWSNANADGEWQHDWISGPYSTVEAAAGAGWAEEMLTASAPDMSTAPNCRCVVIMDGGRCRNCGAPR